MNSSFQLILKMEQLRIPLVSFFQLLIRECLTFHSTKKKKFGTLKFGDEGMGRVSEVIRSYKKRLPEGRVVREYKQIVFLFWFI